MYILSTFVFVCFFVSFLLYAYIDLFLVFFFNDTATTEMYTYCHTPSLHDALPSWPAGRRACEGRSAIRLWRRLAGGVAATRHEGRRGSEDRPRIHHRACDAGPHDGQHDMELERLRGQEVQGDRLRLQPQSGVGRPLPFHRAFQRADRQGLSSQLQAHGRFRSEQPTTELKSLMRTAYAV